MTPAARRGPFCASLIALGLLVFGLFTGACTTTAQPPHAALEPAPEVRPGGEQSYLALGTRLLATNEPALAMRAFTASMSAEGMTAEAMTGAGIAARRQGLVTEARRYFERARDLAPDSAIVHNNLGVVLLELEDYHGARAAFRAALDLAGGESPLARENLERTEAAIAGLAPDLAADPAATWEVVRLGTDRFRITPAKAPQPEPEDAAEAD